MDAACALVRVLGDRDRTTWHAAAEALLELDEEAMPAVILMFQSQKPAERRAALSGLIWLSLEHDEADAALTEDVVYAMWGWWN